MFIAVGETRGDTTTIDQYPDWLGHAVHADESRWPHCSRNDNSHWLVFDNVHPNSASQRQIAAKWEVALDEMYGHCE